MVDVANVARLCNNLHSLYLAGGHHFVETPNYYVFDLLRGHQDARQLAVHADVLTLSRERFGDLPAISVSASEKDGVLTLTLASLCMTQDPKVALSGLYGSVAGHACVTVLSGAEPMDCITLEAPKTVIPRSEFVDLTEGYALTLPAASVVLARIDKG